MQLYCVTLAGRWYWMEAPNIQAASQFVRHWPNVTIRRVS